MQGALKSWQVMQAMVRPLALAFTLRKWGSLEGLEPEVTRSHVS